MCKVQFLPHDKVVDVHAATSILAAARKGKVLLPSKCGGRGACTACKVQVQADETSLSPLTRMEKHMLSERMVKDGYRLGCQCQVTGDVTVNIPEDPLRRTIRLQLEAARREKEQQEKEQLKKEQQEKEQLKKEQQEK